jgi:hypothetical protein
LSVNINAIREHIAECVAWVESRGTAFFIDSNLLLTCTHVVGDQSEVRVRPFGMQSDLAATVLPGRLEVDEGDLALLQVTGAPVDQPAVLLHLLRPFDLMKSRDVVMTGFPKDDWNKPGGYQAVPASAHGQFGDPTTLNAIVFETPAEVAPGLSGSPVLDLATGAVVGVTRYRLGSIAVPGGGGGAIPMALAIERFEQVRRVYEVPPSSARIWWESRSRDEMQAIGRELKGTIGRIDLYLSGGLDAWHVRVNESEGGADDEGFHLDVLSLDITRAVFQWMRGRGRLSSEDLRLVGEILKTALHQGQAGALFDHWQKATDELTVRLIVDPSCKLADLPWEYATTPNGRLNLGTEENLALVRVVPGISHVLPAPGTGRVVALAVQPNQATYPTLTPPDGRPIPWPDADRLQSDIEEVAKKLEPQVIQNPTRSELLQGLSGSGECDILHYQGFARIRPQGAQLALYNDTTDLTPIEMREFINVIQSIQAKVVVIEHSGAPWDDTLDDAGRHIAEPLLKAGVLAVLITRRHVHPAQARLFNMGFYEALATGRTIEHAAQAGRNKVYWDDPLQEQAAFGAFVLWTGEAPGLEIVASSPGGAVNDVIAPTAPPGLASGLRTAEPTTAGRRPRDSSAITG